ncbi:MAG: putative toxin-antitoxin system toxin component, PIN family [Gemmatimonadota bacterium]|uniref:putative toxin-antitoxin system toxin component, PIN family n=1 Tax=Candidatus Palauibacter scopulicola TaxID=3056741 RepID=UPI0023A3875B|nr:putative toxin-antitoxin system toxin component, PIN family [Candidatus Palauibacter scopulicola]MDE2663101.1 putative toxin-antitoxin system toxin component, PIN family [Candidatus Palauibacter scopulicola]
MRLVLDTNIIVAGLLSPGGASAKLLDHALARDFTLLFSVALVLEYESTCKVPAQRIEAGLEEDEVGTFISAMCAVAEPIRSRFLWRPQLRDPADEMVLEAAINGNADALVTFNRRDFEDAADRFGIPVLLPKRALQWISG